MSRADYGRAFKIRSRDVRSYDRTRKYTSNPMGVTTLAKVNGRGAYSARSAAQGKTKSQRIAAARKLLNNTGGNKMQKRGRRASFVSNAAPAAKRRGKRLSAYNSARQRGLTPNAAARSALRKVPWTATERKSGSTFQGMKANPRRAGATPKGKRYRRNEEGPISDAWAAVAREEEAKEQRRAKAKATRAAKAKATRAAKAKSKAAKTTKTTKSKGKSKGKSKTKAARAQYKTVKTTRKVRAAFGKYKRARLYNPRTGKTEYSYMYRTKGGKLRRIPTSAVVGQKVKGTKELPKKVRTARARAAKRIIRSGGAFVPNKRSRARMRATEKARLLRKGYGKAKAARAALKKYPWTQAEKLQGKKLTKAGKVVTSKKRKVTKRKGKTRKVAKSRKVAKTRKVAKSRAKTRKVAKSRKVAKTSKAKRSAAAKKAWRTRKARYAGKKGYRKNAGDKFMALLTTGALAGVGFLLHRGLTAGILMLLTGDQNGAAVAEPATDGLGRLRRRRGMRGVGAIPADSMTKPLVGAGVAVVGSIVSVYAGGEAGPALAGGMIASVLGQVLVYGLKASGHTELAAALGGYSNSMAYSLRGTRRRRGMRGVGAVKSIMPRYAPVGAFQQAAAAGTHNPNRSMGEYFQPNSVGEYFAPSNLEGVGAYEPAGQLAMQAAAGMGQIDDGIRPDTNLDRVLDLAEAAAGLRGVGAAQFAQAAAGVPGGIGEYITAERKNGEFAESRVPTSSQWIPNGPLWAGELGVTGDRQTSDIPAGVLAGPGGNGILSGG